MNIIYVTYPNKEEAQRVSSALIEERLVACANILAAHDSLYWWDDAVQSEQEVAVLYKGVAARFDDVKRRILALHSYDVPCVVSWDIAQGHAPFLQWIEEQAGGE